MSPGTALMSSGAQVPPFWTSLAWYMSCDQGVIGGADGFLALGAIEAEASRALTMASGSRAALLDGLRDQLAGHEAVRGEEVGLLAGLLDGGDHLLFHIVACSTREVVVEEADLRARRAVGAEGAASPRPVTTGAASKTPCWLSACHMVPERCPGPGHEDHIRLGVEELARERGEFLVLRDQDGFHGGALGAEDRLHRGDVALAESVVLGEDNNLLALGVDERAGGGDVLQALPAGAEGVLVNALDRIGGRGSGDVQDLVLLRLFREFQGDTGRRPFRR